MRMERFAGFTGAAASGAGRRRLVAWLAAPIAAAILVLGAAAHPPAAFAQDRQPLLIEGKQTLYQRVLSRPGAVLRAAPDSAATMTADQVLPFTIYYVFDRQDVAGAQWLEVGRAQNGPAEGWLPADKAIDWRQTMTVAFSNPAGRDPTLFFAEREPLIDLLESPDMVAQSRTLVGQANAGDLPAGSPVVSIEPAEHIDISRQFYLLPILQAETAWMESGFTTRVLRIASIPLQANTVVRGPAPEEVLRDFRVGIVFVIDTTISMGPYIDRMREAVRRVYERIGDSEIAERVSFGVVGYRDNLEERPELQYLTRVFAPLERDQDPARLLNDINAIQPAAVSSVGWTEDALAGVGAALEMPDWDEFGGRYVILITDAGPVSASDPLSGTGLGPDEMNRLAQDQGIAVYSLHLLTEEGTDDHDYASAAYGELSTWQNTGLYFPVQAGSVTEFGSAVDQLADSLIDGVRDTMAGRLTQAEADADQAEDDLVARARLVGRAMQLAYLGRQRGARAPDVFEAWAADRVLADPRQAGLEVRVLLTKNQLSDLRDVLATVVELGQSNRLSPEDFFGQLRSAVALLARDPDRLVRAEFESLGELLGEYLEDLPYRSQLMEIDEQTWLAMGPGAQREVLDGIQAKLRLYQRYHDQVDLWIALYENAPEGETVFPIPLDALP